jgi:hypothetical protein
MNACPSFDPQARSRVWKLGSNIDTDQLVPGIYMKLDLDGIARIAWKSCVRNSRRMYGRRRDRRRVRTSVSAPHASKLPARS